MSSRQRDFSPAGVSKKRPHAALPEAAPLATASSPAVLDVTRLCALFFCLRCPLRLVAQDIGFSVREQGFKSPRGYSNSPRGEFFHGWWFHGWRSMDSVAPRGCATPVRRVTERAGLHKIRVDSSASQPLASGSGLYAVAVIRR